MKQANRGWPGFHPVSRLCLGALLALALGVARAEADCPPEAADGTASFEVELRPVRQGAQVSAIAVTSVIRGGLAADAERLSLAAPVVYAGVGGIAERVRDLEVRDCRGAVPLRREDDAPAPGGFPYFRHWHAERAVTFPVTLTYRSAVRPPDERGGPPFDIRATAGGVSGAGSGFLLLPENAASTVSRVRWDLSSLAAGSRAVTSFGAGDFEVEGPPWSLTQGWYMAGPFTRYPDTGHVNGFSAAWLGDLPFGARGEMAWAAEAYTFLGDFFGYLDPPPRYRVFMRTMPGQADGAGTALPDSFMLSSRPAAEADESGAPRDTFLHEMIHQWVGGIEGPQGVTSWFSEGLTTYYTTVLPLAAGFESPAQFLEGINRLARAYYTNPALTWSAEQVVEVGFGDNRIRHLPYQRGALYFADLGAKIRQRSGGALNLHDFMGEVFRRREQGDLHFDHETWVRLVTEAAGPEAAATFREAVLGGAVLVPASDAFGPCFERRPATYRTDEGDQVEGYAWERVPEVPDKACARFLAGGPENYSGRSFESQHTGVFNGVEVDYTATFADVVLRGSDGTPQASIFATTYVRDGVEGDEERPVIFFWNGGPSAASQTLHMAGFGPRRLVIPDDASAPIEPPHHTRPNVHTLLDVADLVFVDPVETGFSRVLPGGDRAWFYSVEGDGESVARFIRQWLTDHGRTAAPRYVVGTSYGSIRAVIVAGALAGTDMPLDGAILFSQGVNLVETTQRENNLIGYASNFSQQAAIAWYHGRTAFQDRPLREVLDTAQRFAMTDYLVALGQGNRLPEAEQRDLAERLAAFSGIGSGWFRDNGLAISKAEFRRELLADENRVLGMTDARYTAPASSEAGPADPTAGVADVQQQHLEEFLGVDLPWQHYRGMAPDSFAEWDWGGTSTLNGSKAPPGARRTVFADFDYPGALVPAFEADDGFRVMIATGIYDTQTTVGPARLLGSDSRYPRDRVVLHEYEAGHSFYAVDAVFQRLADDIRRFID